ncbi:hypothetical protein AVEN_229049-1, partial [Araneus ventricosus]
MAANAESCENWMEISPQLELQTLLEKLNELSY